MNATARLALDDRIVAAVHEIGPVSTGDVVRNVLKFGTLNHATPAEYRQVYTRLRALERKGLVGRDRFTGPRYAIWRASNSPETNADD